MKIGIFYGSSSGVTKKIVKEIRKLMDIDKEDIYDVEDIERGELTHKISEYDFVILATPTYKLGDIQKSWEKHLKELGEIDFKNRYLALVGIGNQERFAQTFVSGMGILYYYVKNNNIKLIGKTNTDGYDFLASSAVERNKFFGLAIDYKNQKELTDTRIENWVKQLEKELKNN